MTILVCDNSIEGVFSGIYHAFQNRMKPSDTKIHAGNVENLELFCTYKQITSNQDHALKVSQTLCNRLSYEVYYDLCTALLCESFPSLNAADAVYHTIALGFAMKKKGQYVLQALANPYVNTVFRSSRITKEEVRHLYGFTRFRELKEGILFANITPKNHIITFLMEYFDDRMPLENFIIYDNKRDIAALHHPGKPSIILTHPSFNQEELTNYSDTEETYEKLWISFFHSIAIESRYNPHLQQQNIPKRFWNNTIELKENP